ncbi:MAG TPA: hypothetical protein VG733_10365 [Chthoniobacteraceae bacterium]|nr:hypothetical protein [Chthoniobacteraceae bacterium]
MASPADAGPPAPAPRYASSAQRGADSAWAKAALGAVVFVLVVEFLLPGFVVAEVSKAGFAGRRVPGRGVVVPPAWRVMTIMLAPAIWLWGHTPIGEFYEWEYRLG